MWRVRIELKVLIAVRTKSSQSGQRGTLSFAHAFLEIAQYAVYLIGSRAGGHVGLLGQPPGHLFLFHAD